MSQIFKWYKDDFVVDGEADPNTRVLKWVSEYLEDASREALQRCLTSGKPR
jgi:hypothetical protein